MNEQIFLAINHLAGKHHVLDSIMVGSAKYLVYVVFLLAVVCIGFCLYKREWKAAVYFFATLAVAFILLKLAGMLNFDHRPFMDQPVTQLVAHASGKSFPSDHTTVSTAIAIGLLLFTRFKKLGVVLLLVAILIGFARVFVGIHYPLDILGGLIVGSLGGLIVFAIKLAIDSRTSSTPQFSSHDS